MSLFIFSKYEYFHLFVSVSPLSLLTCMYLVRGFSASLVLAWRRVASRRGRCLLRARYLAWSEPEWNVCQGRKKNDYLSERIMVDFSSRPTDVSDSNVWCGGLITLGVTTA